MPDSVITSYSIHYTKLYDKDADSLGIHVRRSWELGTTWVILQPDSPRCMEWLDQTRTGLLPDGLTKTLPMTPWKDGPGHGRHGFLSRTVCESREARWSNPPGLFFCVRVPP